MNKTVKQLVQPAFIVCTVLLAVAGAGKSIAIEWFGVILTKEPIELKKSFLLMDKSSLGTYKVLSEHRIDNPDILKELGTEDYIQWQLEDTEAESSSPFKNCQLFITYYGSPDRVPHVPEECYFGGGDTLLASEQMKLNVTFPRNAVTDDSPTQKTLEARRLIFSRKNANYWQPESKFAIYYIFRVNDSYANNRTAVRSIMGANLLGKHSYFSKVEWRFYGSTGNYTIPTQEESIKASEKLLSVIIPVLEKEHWPELSETDSTNVSK